jgi:beta-lactamase class A
VLGLALAVLPFAAGAWAVLPQGLSGQVTDSSGRPVKDAVVTASGPLRMGVEEAATDASGRYRVGARGWPFLPSVSISAPGFVPVRSGGGTSVLRRWPTVSGRAVDDAGAPVTGGFVTLTIGRRAWTGRTDAQGAFSVVAAGAVSGTGWLAVQAERYEPAYRSPSLRPDREVAYSLVLARLSGIVQLSSDPAGQVPTVDGSPAAGCPATPCQLDLSIGPHHLEFQSDLYLPWVQDVQVDRGASVSVAAKLQRKTGTLTVNVPAAGELTIDGQPTGGTGSWTGPVPTGKHSVAFRSSSTWPYSGDVEVSWNQTTVTTLAAQPVVQGDSGGFNQALQAYLASHGGSYGVYVEDVNGRTTLGTGQDSVLEAASVIKMPEAVYLLHQVDAGQIKLSDQVTLQDADFMGGTGSLYSTAHSGDKYSIQDLLGLLIRESDNTAWKALDRTLGIPAVDAYSASIGAPDCHQVSDNCTAREAGSIFSQLARGRLLSTASTQLLLNLLETTVFNDRINYYLPRVTIAHKVGMDGGVINDCGVVFLPGDPITICVFTTTGDPDLGVQVIRDVTRAAVHYYGH